jgi:6-phosphogluconolactonase
MTRSVRQFAQRDELSLEAARHMVAAAHDALARQGWFTLALAGGSTPRRAYELLATAPLAGEMHWQQTHVFFGDERCVPPDDPESNYGMARRALLAHVPIPADHIHRMHGEDPPEQAARAYEDELRDTFAPGVVRFDLVLLGVGPDGHTASLFPGSPACTATARLVAAAPTPALEPCVPRITLTFPALNAAREVLFLVAGAQKADVMARVLAGDENLPAARVQPRETLAIWVSGCTL